MGLWVSHGEGAGESGSSRGELRREGAAQLSEPRAAGGAGATWTTGEGGHAKGEVGPGVWASGLGGGLDFVLKWWEATEELGAGRRGASGRLPGSKAGGRGSRKARGWVVTLGQTWLWRGLEAGQGDRAKWTCLGRIWGAGVINVVRCGNEGEEAARITPRVLVPVMGGQRCQ